MSKITIPTLTIAGLIHDLPGSPMVGDVLRRMDAAFAQLSARDPCPRMRATYAADQKRIRDLCGALDSEVPERRAAARQALRTLGDDYRNVAQSDPKDDAAQDRLLAEIVARADARAPFVSAPPRAR